MQKRTKNKKISSSHHTPGEGLRGHQVFYKHFTELTPEAVVVHQEGIIVYLNPTAFKLVGAKNKKEVIGESIMKFIHHDSLSLIKTRIKTMLRKRKVASLVEEKFIDMKGKIFIAQTKAVPFIFEGKPAILAILHDITRKKMSLQN